MAGKKKGRKEEERRQMEDEEELAAKAWFRRNMEHLSCWCPPLKLRCGRMTADLLGGHEVSGLSLFVRCHCGGPHPPGAVGDMMYLELWVEHAGAATISDTMTDDQIDQLCLNTVTVVRDGSGGDGGGGGGGGGGGSGRDDGGGGGGDSGSGCGGDNGGGGGNGGGDGGSGAGSEGNAEQTLAQYCRQLSQLCADAIKQGTLLNVYWYDTDVPPQARTAPRRELVNQAAHTVEFPGERVEHGKGMFYLAHVVSTHADACGRIKIKYPVDDAQAFIALGLCCIHWDSRPPLPGVHPAWRPLPAALPLAGGRDAAPDALQEEGPQLPREAGQHNAARPSGGAAESSDVEQGLVDLSGSRKQGSAATLAAGAAKRPHTSGHGDDPLRPGDSKRQRRAESGRSSSSSSGTSSGEDRPLSVLKQGLSRRGAACAAALLKPSGGLAQPGLGANGRAKLPGGATAAAKSRAEEPVRGARASAQNLFASLSAVRSMPPPQKQPVALAAARGYEVLEAAGGRAPAIVKGAGRPAAAVAMAAEMSAGQRAGKPAAAPATRVPLAAGPSSGPRAVSQDPARPICPPRLSAVSQQQTAAVPTIDAPMAPKVPLAPPERCSVAPPPPPPPPWQSRKDTPAVAAATAAGGPLVSSSAQAARVSSVPSAPLPALPSFATVHNRLHSVLKQHGPAASQLYVALSTRVLPDLQPQPGHPRAPAPPVAAVATADADCDVDDAVEANSGFAALAGDLDVPWMEPSCMPAVDALQAAFAAAYEDGDFDAVGHAYDSPLTPLAVDTLSRTCVDALPLLPAAASQAPPLVSPQHKQQPRRISAHVVVLRRRPTSAAEEEAKASLAPSLAALGPPTSLTPNFVASVYRLGPWDVKLYRTAHRDPWLTVGTPAPGSGSSGRGGSSSSSSAPGRSPARTYVRAHLVDRDAVLIRYNPRKVAEMCVQVGALLAAALDVTHAMTGTDSGEVGFSATAKAADATGELIKYLTAQVAKGY